MNKFTDWLENVYDKIHKGGINKMVTIEDSAKAYEPQLTLNIADLDEVPINLELTEANKVDSEGKAYTYKFFVLNGKEYRVPNSVLEEIKTILELKPTVTKVNVTKAGSGLATKYSVKALN
jgi:hypothetical protein|tara:strand:- start:15489 stop:15851 length:363 start_codon:yes stop_codon:yes gene_type:complete